ncbi:MAG TPA: nickel pincer cofactor biosynthesis protein LarB [Vicinamibacteria bacterium]|jgi:NCAIR mutase (PurE)-related protein
MDPERLRTILKSVERGETTVDAALEKLRTLSFEDLGFAKVDHHRGLRRGFPEVIFGPGKTPSQIASIARRITESGQVVLVTKTTEEAYRAVAAESPEAMWHEDAKAITVGQRSRERVGPMGKASVLSAGTSDIPVAEEAALTAELMGVSVGRLYDVGVAGLHRLLDHLEVLTSADVLLVVAGMDGALPSVVSGLSRAPVIAVPTSVGYGASFQGLSALLAMLNGCSPGVAVVNIDNGFGAGYLAGLLCRVR